MSAAAEFDSNEFDVAIVDEASQASEPATFAPLLAAKRMVLAGDHKQLPPYASDEMRDRDLEVSLYEHLVNRYGQDATQLLDTQSRMHEAIVAFPSATFYDGQVKTAD
jgi:superfamily I DNA and/or RNA helicase